MSKYEEAGAAAAIAFIRRPRDAELGPPAKYTELQRRQWRSGWNGVVIKLPSRRQRAAR